MRERGRAFRRVFETTARTRPEQIGLGAAVLLLAGVAAVAPLFAGPATPTAVGLALLAGACLELAHGVRRSTAEGRRAAWIGGAITLAMGAVVLQAGDLAGRAVLLLLAGWFAADALRYAVGHAGGPGPPLRARALPALGYGLLAVLLLLIRGATVRWAMGAAAALRLAGTAGSIVTAPAYTREDTGDTVVLDLDLADSPAVADLARELAAKEQGRAGIDRGWIAAFAVTLFGIHLGRMGLDRSALGILSPLVAMAGDLVVALLIAFGLVVPARLLARRTTRGLERRAWSWCLDARGPGWARTLVRVWLERRLRFAVRLRAARYSLRAALSRGLQIGLPAAAFVAATTPVFGMSWFFDTENWAAGLWNRWAEARADTWREAMTRAVLDDEPRAGAEAFAVRPPGVVDGVDFAFIVIGDPGEGDASQHILRDQLLAVARREDVRFVVVSSDVVYPVGAMKDYEAKFWLPFKGSGKPVYAIPGNHDWFDALEAFAATFMTPEAARRTMRARIEVDNRLTGTTDRRIEELIAQAGELRRQYGVPTGFQRAPFFQLQTRDFALLAVDTGVLRRIDPVQRAWLQSALAAARGKSTMAILGHPFYAGGLYRAEGDDEFVALHGLLREHGVALVMAGDTHDLEYYVERGDGGGRGSVHHVVNGGGGAYLSFGTALDWPAVPAAADWAFYPTTAQVTGKILATLPVWKRPFWWWTRYLGAWPYSVEWLSAAFDVNVAPFYQSFMEIRVEPSSGRVRLRPYGVDGRLRWADLQVSSGLRPSGVASEDPVEWSLALTGR
jgi:3',5'-cyclic AMP phosphodiesterase CpdA